MVARVGTVAFQGIDVVDVDVQVQIAPGIPAFRVVGLPDKAVAESRERVRAALLAIGLTLPAKRIIVNLAPADLLKEGSHFDLPIMLGLLLAMDVLPPDTLMEYTVLGELALDGAVAPVAGALPAAIHAGACGRGLVCPVASAARRRGRATSTSSRHLRFLLSSITSRETRFSPGPSPWRQTMCPQRWIFAISRGRKRQNARLRSPRPAATTCSCAGRRAPENRCSRPGCRGYCRRWMHARCLRSA